MLRTILKLEFIGENYFAYKRAVQQGKAERIRSTERYVDFLGRDKSRPWVARVVGVQLDGFSFARAFVNGQIDYSQANSTGSRDVYIYYPLIDGLYEVNARESWTRVRRYFIKVEYTQIIEISREEVYLCLENAKS